ncbi:MAG: hypothetical protein IJZ79_03530 [Bacilli bacterium]|nr:hypothetical protein [Bacilli bacterium]MBQ8218800.1 hypothetical protein [Bacilli bacterium]
MIGLNHSNNTTSLKNRINSLDISIVSINLNSKPEDTVEYSKADIAYIEYICKDMSE